VILAELGLPGGGNGRDAVLAELGNLREGRRLMVRDATHKHVGHEQDSSELYNLVDDPGEVRNLFDQPTMSFVTERFHAVLQAEAVD